MRVDDIPETLRVALREIAQSSPVPAQSRMYWAGDELGRYD